MPPPADLVIVRHGPGRGREPGYLQEVLDTICAARPALARRIRHHATGTAPPDLDGVAAVLFWLGDPLRELYPACHAEARAIADEARTRGIRVANDPDALSNTRKSVQAARWHAAGLPVAIHHPFADAAGLAQAVERARFPAILRPDDLHAQADAHVCATADDVRRLPPERIRFPGALVEFVDVRAGHRRRFWERRSPWTDLFHKKRQFVLGRTTLTSHVFFSPRPLVASHTSLFAGRPDDMDERRYARYLRRALREDVRYWERRTEAPELMHAAMAALGIDFAAIDYSSLGNGEVILWEANPYFYFPPMRERMFVRERRTPERVASYHAAIGDFLGRLADGAP